MFKGINYDRKCGSDDIIDKISRSEIFFFLQGKIGKEKDGFPNSLSIILLEEYRLRELTDVQILLV